MPEAPKPAAKGVVGGFLGKTTAGLPNWAWGLVIVGGIAAAVIIPRLFNKANTTANATAGGSTTDGVTSEPSNGLPATGSQQADDAQMIGLLQQLVQMEQNEQGSAPPGPAPTPPPQQLPPPSPFPLPIGGTPPLLPPAQQISPPPGGPGGQPGGQSGPGGNGGPAQQIGPGPIGIFGSAPNGAPVQQVFIGGQPATANTAALASGSGGLAASGMGPGGVGSRRQRRQVTPRSLKTGSGTGPGDPGEADNRDIARHLFGNSAHWERVHASNRAAYGLNPWLRLPNSTEIGIPD